MKVLITGAEGQLGKQIKKQLTTDNFIEVIAVDHNELDITEFDQTEKIINKITPDVVVNCAAYTEVDKCETEVEKAYSVNAIGPKNLAIICESINAKLVHISTDYVFAGDEHRPRREDDVTKPNTIYGKSKLLGEEYVKTFSTKYFIIRTAWLYGEGNNFVNTMLKLAQQTKVINVVGDQFGSPTSTKDLAILIHTLIKTKYYGVFHGTCEGECSWYDLACCIFKIKKYDIKVNKVTSQEYKRAAQRPQYSVLDNFMLKLYNINNFRNWEEALKDYLKES